MTNKIDPTDRVDLPAEELVVLPKEVIENVKNALSEGNTLSAVDQTLLLHRADAANLIEQIDPVYREALVEALGERLDAEILTHLEDKTRAEVVNQLGSKKIANAISNIETDDAVEVLEGLDEVARSNVLEALGGAERTQIEIGLSFPDDSAGRLMQQSFISVPEFWNIGQAIDYLRESDDLPDDFYEIFVVDPAGRPVGTLPLNRFLRGKRPIRVGDIMDKEPRLIPVTMDQEDVAFRFQQYDLASAGVVDHAGRLVGMIMIDDIVDVINEEAEEDLLRLAGVSESGLASSVISAVKNRMSWLLVNLLTAILASIVIYIFQGTIEQVVSAAVLMPIVASMGGNAGTQTLTVAVRAMATHTLTASNASRIITNEFLVGGLNGIVFAVIVTFVGILWIDDPYLGLVFGAATLITMAVAGLSGILIPLGLGRLGIDPAAASPVFVTTVTDVVGFFSFLGLVAVWLV